MKRRAVRSAVVVVRPAPIALCVVFSLATLSGCVDPEPGPRDDVPHYGVTLSPRSYRGFDLDSFFDEARSVGDTVSWSGDWLHLAEQGSAPDIVVRSAAERGLDAMVLATFFRPHDGALFRPFNNTTRTFYVGAAEVFAEARTPRYLGFGVELNLLAERNATAMDGFVALWPSVYEAAKRGSPDTVVFPVFQYERMIGLRRGLANDTASIASQWSLLERFSPRDALGFTTFPGLVYDDPSKVPRGHYDALKDLDGPILITETGWHRSDSPPGWESSDPEQSRYIEWFFAHVPTVDVVVWSALYDTQGDPPFDAMGLVNGDRTTRPSWDAWRIHAKPDPFRA